MACNNHPVPDCRPGGIYTDPDVYWRYCLPEPSPCLVPVADVEPVTPPPRPPMRPPPPAPTPPPVFVRPDPSIPPDPKWPDVAWNPGPVVPPPAAPPPALPPVFSAPPVTSGPEVVGLFPGDLSAGFVEKGLAVPCDCPKGRSKTTGGGPSAALPWWLLVAVGIALGRYWR